MAMPYVISDMKDINHIYGNSEEKFLKTVVLYPNDDHTVFADPECTKRIDPDVLFDLLKKDQVLISSIDGYTKPIIFYRDTNGPLKMVCVFPIAENGVGSVIFSS